MDNAGTESPRRCWLAACAALAAGEFSASLVPQLAEAWPAVAVLALLVALFGFGVVVRGWWLAVVFLFGAAMFLRSSVDAERMYRERPWLRGRMERRAQPSRSSSLVRAMEPARAAFARCTALGLERSGAAAALNRAILLGDRRSLPRQVRSTFVLSGTMHVFAVSGVHVMAVVHVLALLLRLVLFLPRRVAGAAAVPCVWGYVCLVGAPPSAVRAAMMATAYYLAPLFWRRPDAAMAWALAFLAVCGPDPLKIGDVGCMLSFAVMLAIILAAECCQGRRGPLQLLWMTFAAWAAGVPLTAHVFGHFTPGGLVANLALVPAAGFAVASGVLGMLAGLLSEGVAAHFNNMAALASSAMAGIAGAVARLPFADFEVARWSLTACAAWYAALVLLIMGVRSWMRPHL